MRRKVNRDLIRWSTGSSSTVVDIGIVPLVRCRCNRSQEQQQEKEKKTVRDTLSVSMDYVGCGKVTTREGKKGGGWSVWTFQRLAVS